MNKIVLASQSPRRKELMDLLEIDYIVVKSDIEEIVDDSIDVHEVAMDLALQKAVNVSKFFEDSLVLGFDTIVVYDGHVLGKPKDDLDAKRMLMLLSGHKHQVITGVALRYKGENEVFFASTDVVFNELEEQEIEQYIKSKEHLDKAGSYGIQGKAAKFVKEIQGDFYNVMGLPVSKLYKALQSYMK